MKKASFLLLFCFISIYIFSVSDDSDIYCPAGPGYNWVYSLYSKKEKIQKSDAHTDIKKTETSGGVQYYDYQTDVRNACFIARKDDAGVYFKAVKLDFPVFGFINVDIIFDPVVCFVKFPLKQGNIWTYDGTVSVSTLAFINIKQKIKVDFVQLGMETVDVSGRTVAAYRLHALSSRSWDMEKPVYIDYWMAENAGFVKGETINSRMELVSVKKGE